MSFFDNDKKIIEASAPGRLDVMGGIADYSSSLILQMPIAQTTTVQLQKREDSIFQLRSHLSSKRYVEFTFDAKQLAGKSFSEAGSLIKSNEGGDWAAYVIGCFFVLHKEKNIPLEGMNVLIDSKVPAGKGVASSAALEVAVMNAICKIYDIALSETELPVLAQKVENNVVGAACGLMDQLAVHLGKKNKLLPLVCDPHTVRDAVSIPKGIYFVGIDSGVRHAVGGSSYADVRTATFMAYSVIAKMEGVSFDQLREAKSRKDFGSLPYSGYLANIPVSVFEKKYASDLPETISGQAFINDFGVSIDDATTVDPAKSYNLLACARHPVYENFRTNLFFQLLCGFSPRKRTEETLRLLGELMLQSHSSYSKVGLGNEATDDIVAMVRNAGYEAGLYGARITGGGSGGVVAILCYGKKGKEEVKRIYKEYRKKSGKKVFFFSGSSDGALTLNF